MKKNSIGKEKESNKNDNWFKKDLIIELPI